MSRRKAKKRSMNAPSIRGGASLSELMKKSLFGGGSVLNQLLAETRPPGETDRWIEELEMVLEAYPDEYEVDPMQLHRMEFKIANLYDDMVVGTCREHGSEHTFFVQFFDEDSAPAGCTCTQSSGTNPCAHTYTFVYWLITRMGRSNDSIAARINRKQFDRGKPSLESFQISPVERTRREVQRLFSELDDLKLELDDGEVFPTQAEAERSRIAWDFVPDGNSLTVQCLLQLGKKKTDGWTKGRKVSLGRIWEHSGILTEVDQRVSSKISVDRDYYYGDGKSVLSACDAAPQLIGAPNVSVSGQPVSVEWTTPCLYYHEHNDLCWLGTGSSKTPTNARRFLYSEWMIEVDPDAAKLRVSPLTKSETRCMMMAYEMKAVPISLRDEVIHYALQMQKFITVRFPEEVGGKVFPESTTPVLLLRLGSDGALAYAWRVRLSFGQLSRTGSGALARVEDRDGEKVQIARSFDDEMNAQRALCQSLDLDLNASHGTVADFEEVLRLLARVRELESTEPTDATEPTEVAERTSYDASAPKIEVLWDEQSQKPLKLLGNVTPQNLRVGIAKSRDWFQLSGECKIDDQQVDMPTLLRSLQNLDRNSIRGEYVKLGDLGWAKISEALQKQLRKLHDCVNEDRKRLVFDATSAKAVHELLANNIQVDAARSWTECLSRMERASQLNPTVPENLNADLRDYQREGYGWMRRLAEWGVGGILADDMGLGKTLQALAVMLDRAHEGPALVIAPTSVGFNWVREAERFAPDLQTHLYRETDRDDFLSSIGPGNLVVCSYGLALRDAKKLENVEWGTLVLDEAQAIKNARSKTATAIATLPAKWKLALTGTPVENHLGELWSLFRAVSPGVFGGWEQFRKRYAAPIERDNDEDRRLALRERLQPFILRRTKREVLKDLPPRTESNQYVELSAKEREAYDRVRLSTIGELDEIAKLEDIQDQRFRLLALLTRLRQLACSPRLVHPDWPGRSSKLQHLADTLIELRSEGHRALVFSQFVTHLELIREMLVEEGITYQYLDGSTSPTQRQERVDAFQKGEGDVFLISLKAGGTGLNLTAADYVIHMDPWWNPAVEDQATDRAHRIGQDKPVMVYRMISQGTIEEEILKLHESKRDLVAGVIEGSQGAAKLSARDLIDLIRKQ